MVYSIFFFHTCICIVLKEEQARIDQQISQRFYLQRSKPAFCEHRIATVSAWTSYSRIKIKRKKINISVLIIQKKKKETEISFSLLSINK